MVVDQGSDVLTDIFSSESKVTVDFPGEGSLDDILSFGFSYIEHEDFMVAYVAANPEMMKKIIAHSDAQIQMRQGFIGRIWTADLIVSNKVRKNHIMFANGDTSVVLNLNVYPNKIGDF